MTAVEHDTGPVPEPVEGDRKNHEIPAVRKRSRNLDRVPVLIPEIAEADHSCDLW